METNSRVKRSCIVKDVVDIGVGMRRLVVAGAELEAILNDPVIGEPGAWLKLFPPGVPGRAYTVRSVDLSARTIALDFVVHGDQPGTVSTWVRDVQPGAELQVAGPRGEGFRLLPTTQWLWVGADASALPAISNIIESLPEALNLRAVLMVLNEVEPQPLKAPEKADVRWLATSPVPTALNTEDARLDRASGQVWLAGEASWVKAWKAYWVSTVGLEPRQVVAKGYWKAGELDYRD